jgi:protein-S-isoprenylcysteine O-methyltransferase Ste14
LVPQSKSQGLRQVFATLKPRSRPPIILSAIIEPYVKLVLRTAYRAQFVTGAAAALFRREGTELNPASATNQKLVMSGPFRFTRNPMYLGLVLVTLGIAFWAGVWPMFLAPIATFATANWVHIPFEEAKMRRQFNSDFESYARKARRWI